MDNADGAVTSAAPPAARTRIRFVIDARRSRFTVQAFASGILAAMGHNPTIGIRTFSGEVEFDPGTPEAAGLRLTIQSASLEVLDDVSDKDRREIERVMKNDVLEVSRYPQITYEAPTVAVNRLDSSIYSATLSGSLTFHGVTRNQSLTARIIDSGETLRASGDFTLRQSDYQIKPVSVAGGALKLKDELKFSFEIIARRQDSSVS
jgi:polyisoprenoid-binding protein YceI